MSHDQYVSQVRSSDLARLEESDINPMILRSHMAGRSFARLPFVSATPCGASACEGANVLTRYLGHKGSN